MTDIVATKSPGHDWLVRYTEEQDDGPDTIETMSVFGQMTIEEAIADARHSLNALIPYTGAIVSAMRDDQAPPRS